MTDLRIGVVGIPGKWSTEALADAVEERTGFRLVIDMGHVTLDLQRGEMLYDNIDLCKLDGLIIKKISEIYKPDVLDRMEILRYAQAKGVQVFSDPEAIIRLIDRLACTVTLAATGVPIPPTVITEDPEVALETATEFGTAVFKPLFSTKARGMALIEGDSFRAINQIASFASDNPVMYIQKKLDLSGKDLGLIFLDGEYLGTYARVAQGKTWNTTIDSGGKYEPFEPDAELIEMARKAQEPFGLTFTTVDVALTPQGPIVFEVSAFGGYGGAKYACGIDAPGLVADHVIAKIRG
ncbi:GAK system ATP-grasp enzyme [Aliiruegeria sabulilitoris]|uniref:GAK system ATP-grasp enzyme n=1 Tax=Aliiruegeria sabulilitoris TaxID=1510458 RepID=UPI0008322AEB|nr:GAK system ATP-grasp enzyme [Aliiruegeria sabulilitoris]NDR55510.1 GAK system ATP-grasp enzyme [Pseudoruegeria sp. M32A2M]